MSRDATLAACRDEIVRHHEVIAGWLTGTLPRSAIDDFAAAHTPAFTMVTPDGELLTWPEVLALVTAAHGTAPGLTIGIRDVTVVAEAGALLVAGYTEAHPERARRSTVVFERSPGGLRWVHLHETWAS